MKKLLIVLAVIVGLCSYTNAFAELQVIDGPITAQSVTVNGQITIRGGSPGSGKVLTSDSAGLATWQTAGLPLGTSGQTLRHDGSAWIANGLIYNNGTNVGIGTTAPTGKVEINSDVQPALNIKVNNNDSIWFWKTGANPEKHTFYDKSGVGWRFYDISGELFGIAPTAGDVNIKGTIKIGGGSPTTGKVLTATDSTGLATWQTLSSGMGGSGTANYIPKFTASTTIGNSAIYQSGNNIGIGTTNPVAALEVSTSASAGTPSLIVNNTYVSGGINPDSNRPFAIRMYASASESLMTYIDDAAAIVHYKNDES